MIFHHHHYYHHHHPPQFNHQFLKNVKIILKHGTVTAHRHEQAKSTFVCCVFDFSSYENKSTNSSQNDQAIYLAIAIYLTLFNKFQIIKGHN